MADKQRAKVTADIKQNRLYIALPGDASKMVLEKVYTDVRFCVADLKPGFDVVSDFSQCTIGHLNGIPILRKIMNYLVINQPREVVRVVGKRSLIFKQLMRLSSVLNGYKAIYVNTLEEAEEQLTHSTKRKGLRFQIHRPRVEYKRNQEEGEGNLVDISISGCAIMGAKIPLRIGEEISITIPFHQDHETLTSFTLAAKVVRVQDDLFAVQFVDLNDDQKTQLYKCLAYEAQSDDKGSE
jgi:hypothetical protein